MDKLELILVVVLAIPDFVGPFYLKKISPKIQLVITSVAKESLLFEIILSGSKYTFMLILGLAWIVRCTKEINGLKHSN